MRIFQFFALTSIKKTNNCIILGRNDYFCTIILDNIGMENKDLNRIKVVLAEKKRTNKWLAEQLGKDPATISKWCTNTAQPSLELLLQMAECLDVDIKDLVRVDALKKEEKQWQ